LIEITSSSDLENLTLLGGNAAPGRTLETFPNHHPQRDYTVTMQTKEFTCLCPMTGQPDFAQLTIRYIPDKLLLESKSLKLYLSSFRSEGGFHEHVANTILDDIVKAVAPRWCKVNAEFAVRGGIAITVEGEYHKTLPAMPARANSEPYASISKEGTEKVSGAETRRREAPRRREKERDRGYPEREQKEFPRRKYQAKPDDNPAEQVKRRWQQGARPEKKDYAAPHWEDRPPVEPRKSERRTTKSLGQTRTWRKRT